ncbi:MAG: heterodisulfide reductase-related iron-sulfur binding cluster [Thermodesulfobacteriota bacterium]
MKRSKKFVSEVLSALKENIQRTGDPLGIKKVYWTGWVKGFNLKKGGETILLTARMYQMLPYIMQITGLVASAKPFLSRNGFRDMVHLGNRIMGDKIIRFKALGSRELKLKSNHVLRGIVSALDNIGQRPAYLYEDEPYSGVLLYDLGLDEYIEDHIKNVYTLLKSYKVKKVIGVDPHTVFMLKEIYPKYIDNYDIEVQHYLEILSENEGVVKKPCNENSEKDFVIHDSCYMARELGIIEQVRRLSVSLGITIMEPENTKLDTACCGGPIEYAFRDLTEKVSRARIQELSAISKNIIVECPICLINLRKYEKEMGIKVWDIGELLFEALDCA